MTLDPSRVSALISRLQCLHAELHSWRKVQRLHYPRVKFGTLQRIAGGDGYLPKDRKILRALGLLERRKRTRIEKKISEMARDTRKAVLIVRKK